MRIHIQSKTGNYNTVTEITVANLRLAMDYIRSRKGYYLMCNNVNTFVPFEEVQCIREAGPDEQA